jgi:hypothetical protein
VAYTPDKPNLVPSTAVLKTTIPGWGVDLDPKDRPAVPKENFNPRRFGVRWDFPERQVAHYERERSTEHAFVTPVFGTSCPPRGISGVIRRLAYRRYSEGRAAHWLLLMFADRVDVLESRIGEALKGRIANPIAEMGLGAEIKRHGIHARLGRGRTDVKHLPIDIVMFAAPRLITGAVLLVAGRAVASTLRRRRRSRRVFARVGRLLQLA